MTRYSVLIPSEKSEGYGVRIISERLVRGIAPSPEPVQRLCDACNSAGLSAEHFDDVLENFLADYETF